MLQPAQALSGAGPRNGSQQLQEAGSEAPADEACRAFAPRWTEQEGRDALELMQRFSGPSG